MKIVVVSGGFDPLHSGHIKVIKEARMLGDMLIVGINSDEWLARKKGQAFMPWTERLCILNNLSAVDEVYTFDDEDDTACHLLQQVQAHYPNAEIVFANGGDRTAANIPEMTVTGVEYVFGVGGESKVNSSSWILQKWNVLKTERPWGYYCVLHDVPGTKVKELTINPGKSISLQRHKFRHEFWHISSGKCAVEQYMPGGYMLPTIELSKHKELVIPANDWHRVYNPYDEPCKIVEIQYGELCEEDDIERK
jgi:D-beta-D-heptose 7-phosphate kinase/D-beta-D-heptose 1-phosphate adenosyltransferase